MKNKQVFEGFNKKYKVSLFNGDCLELLSKIPNNSIDLVITSPPYCIGKAYEDPSDDINTFRNTHQIIFPEIYRVLKEGGSICWQVGYHVFPSSIIPLDYLVYDIFTEQNETNEFPILLKNRIMWTFGHGLNASKRFSGRHEVILWFTKGNSYNFDLDNVRVPQKYPGKRSYKGKNKGELSGNPLGKNPSDVWDISTDVWDIPNVKANHVEKTEHPCQFPVAIPRRLIKALVPPNGIILDPFMGAGTSGVSSILEDRRFVGSEIDKDFYQLSKKRITDALDGKVLIREDVPIYKPDLNTSVAKLPDEFARIRGVSVDE